jgi:hypothetical protein
MTMIAWDNNGIVGFEVKAGQRQSIKVGNRSFESVAKFK